MIRYRAIVPVVGKTRRDGTQYDPYNGKTCGVQFSDGVAVFDDLSVSKAVGLTAEQVANALVRDFGYQVFTVDADGHETVFTPKIPKTVSPPKSVSGSQAESQPLPRRRRPRQQQQQEA